MQPTQENIVSKWLIYAQFSHLQTFSCQNWRKKIHFHNSRCNFSSFIHFQKEDSLLFPTYNKSAAETFLKHVKNLYKWKHSYWIVLKTLLQKEEVVIISNISFCHDVFKSCPLKMCQKIALITKYGLSKVQISTKKMLKI